MAEILQKNQTYTFTVESLCGNGNGVAKHFGFVVFIPNTAPGDVVRAKLIKLTKSYGVGKLESVLTPSPERAESGCPVAGKCGGCGFWHISYEAESKIKRAMIDDAFERIAHIPLRVSDYLAAKEPTRYRNKVIYPVGADKEGKLIAGFYAPSSHRIVPHDDCPIGPEIFAKIRDAVLSVCSEHAVSAYDETSGKGLLRGIYMRIGDDEKVLLTLIINGASLGKEAERALCEALPSVFPTLCGILLNENTNAGNGVLGERFRTLWGQSFLAVSLCGRRFRVSPDAFFQVNPAQTERLYRTACAFADVKEGDTLFDLYCGTGTIGILAAKAGVKLYGVEIEKAAAENAAENARENGVEGRFLCLDAGEALDSDRLKNLLPDVIIIDPPRKGCGAEAAERIAALGAKRIVYISCNPQTLARDLVTFAECGYDAKKAVGVDLFPRTGHVETVVQLVRKTPDTYIDITVDMDELDLTSSEAKATYDEIKDYIFVEH